MLSAGSVGGGYQREASCSFAEQCLVDEYECPGADHHPRCWGFSRVHTSPHPQGSNVWDGGGCHFKRDNQGREYRDVTSEQT